MKKRTLNSLQLHKKVISRLQNNALKGRRSPSDDPDPNGSGDTHPVYSCHPRTCATNER